MRRFIAYLSLAFAGLISIAATFNQIFVRSDSNIEYSDGLALHFRISSNDDTDLPEDGSAAQEIAEIMETRLKTYGVSEYDVVTEGNDTVKAILSESQDSQYTQIKTYLAFDGAFALGTTVGTSVAVGDEFKNANEDAYVEFINSYPSVVIPVNYESSTFKAVIEEAEKARDESGSSADEETDNTVYVYLAYNFIEGEDTISQMISGQEDYDEDKADKILMKFDISNIWRDDNKQAIATSINIDADSDGSVSTKDVSNGTQQARYYTYLLNADSLPYDVEFIYETVQSAYFENIISTGMRQTVAMSRTMIATLIAMILVCLVLAVYFRWSTLAVFTLSLGSTYLALVLSIAFSIEFNVATIIGLIAVAITSIISGIITINKIKEECYRGRSLKKANQEGFKKALLPVVDVNVILVIIGAVSFWLGGSTLLPFAGVAVFGGIVSLIFNLLGLRGLLWLLLNNTAFQGQYSKTLGVDEKNVPNLMNEEKQSYFGEFQEKDFKKGRKPLLIATLALFIATLAGSIAFGVMNNGNLYNRGSYNVENTYLYVETTTNNSVVDSYFVEDLLGRTYVTVNGSDSLLTYDSIETFTRDDTKDKVTTTYTYIVVTFDKNYTGKESAYIVDIDGTTQIASGLLNEIHDNYINDNSIDTYASASFKIGNKLSSEQPDMKAILVSCTVALAFSAAYLFLRYGISRFLGTLLTTTVVAAINIGLFALLRFVITSNSILLSLPFVLLFTLAASIIFLDKEKEMKKEDFTRTRDSSYEHRNEIMEKATSYSFGAVLIANIVAVLITINYAGIGPRGALDIFGTAALGVIIATVLIPFLLGPSSQLFYKWFKKLNIKAPELKKKKKTKKNKNVKKNSSEPEEAIFIGIND